MAANPVNGIVLRGEQTLYFLDGKEVTEAVYRNLFPIPDAGIPAAPKSCSAWPMRSEALAVHPDQVTEFNERNRAAGLGTRYDGDGTAVIPDRNERKRLLKHEGMHDKDGGYGDG